MKAFRCNDPRFKPCKTCWIPLPGERCMHEASSLAVIRAALDIMASTHSLYSHSGAFNHAHVSATEHAPPLPAGPVADRWVLDHNRVQVLSTVPCGVPPSLQAIKCRLAACSGSVQVGSGRQHYEKARRLLERWRHMDLGIPVAKQIKYLLHAYTLACSL